MLAPFVPGPLRDAIWHLFNMDLKASETAIEDYQREWPDDPLASAILAAVRFYHYVSLRIPERDTRSIVGVLLGPGIAMPPGMQKEIGRSLRRAQDLARMANGNLNATLALCIMESVNRDGLALVSKRWGPAIEHAERAQMLAKRMLEIEPSAHDAYFVFGSTEYLLSRVPGPLRGFVSIRGATGDKGKAIAFCQTAALSGWFFREFARRTLVNLYVEDNRLAEAEKMLAGLVAEFPGNPTLRTDWLALKARI